MDTPDTGAEAGTDDGGTDDGGGSIPTDCVTEESDRFELGSDSRNATRHVALAAGSGGFVVVYPLNEGGFDDMIARRVPSSGAAGEPIALTDTFASERAPALVWNGSGYIVGWHDNDGRGFEVVTRALNAEGQPLGASRVISTPTTGRLHDSLALAVDDDGVVAAFVEEDVARSTRLLQSIRLADDGSPMGTPSVITDPPANEPALVGREGGSVVVWARSGDDGATAVARLLDASAMAAGAVLPVGTQPNAGGVVGVARTPAGQLATVFDANISGGARQEIRFREHAADGTPRNNEVVLSPGTSQGRAPGIAAFAGGYAVAYRATVDPELTGPTIRLLLVSPNGTVNEVTNLDRTSAEGGAVHVAVGFDGTILVAWAEATDTGTTLVARRLRCGT
ncbi:MAG: hypothetical protein H6724_13170 [Sandaracinus sp.]|nr:hypothetical protein [Sandaracinus sp.]